MELQWPLILFTTLVALGAGLFGTQALMAVFGVREEAQVPAWSLLWPCSWRQAGSRCSSISGTEADLQRVQAPGSDHSGIDRERGLGRGRRGLPRAHAQVRQQHERARKWLAWSLRRLVGRARGRDSALITSWRPPRLNSASGYSANIGAPACWARRSPLSARLRGPD